MQNYTFGGTRSIKGNKLEKVAKREQDEGYNDMMNKTFSGEHRIGSAVHSKRIMSS